MVKKWTEPALYSYIWRSVYPEFMKIIYKIFARYIYSYFGLEIYRTVGQHCRAEERLPIEAYSVVISSRPPVVTCSISLYTWPPVCYLWRSSLLPVLPYFAFGVPLLHLALPICNSRRFFMTPVPSPSGVLSSESFLTSDVLLLQLTFLVYIWPPIWYLQRSFSGLPFATSGVPLNI